MEHRFSESVAALKCKDAFEIPAGHIAAILHDGLPNLDFNLDTVDFVDADEVVFYGEGMILSVCRIHEFGHHLLVAAETPCDRTVTEADDQLRLLLCASATRILTQAMAIESISWWHKGAVHVTDGNRDFGPACARDATPSHPRKGVRAALSSIGKGLCGKDGGVLTNALRRHFPADEAIVIGSDTAA